MAQKIRVSKKVQADLDAVKHKLTVKEALELLAPHKERTKLRVHTFQTGSGILMGCDWDLKDVKANFKECAEDEISLSGENMRSMSHGVAFWKDNRGWTFLETDKAKIDAIHKLRNIKESLK